MKEFQLNKLRYQKINSVDYLRAIEKSIMKKKRVRTLEEKITFKKFLKEHHSEEEIELMANELDLNTTNDSDYIKLVYSIVIPLVVSFFSIMSVVIVFFLNSDFQLAIKMAEAKQSYEQANALELLNSFLMMWLGALFTVFFSSRIWMKLLPRRKVLYLSILKSIKY
ncbi:hypothetical protein [Peribacillus loiseleuriae]|uniref:Uncharacterized protein n=1 Tax=Peribacillus loiseleuriae TaxID=1679170 RepID=A0A0K9GRJ5_9BACI|nr:hypothetical protein [Peribacillus loiseleuriae]KMY49221.1 hypothetical protein AC625_06530 [Peribacillus loiseleuriae]